MGSGGFSGSGSGTEADPYLIFNPIQLYNVRNFTGIKGVVFKLMADIDLTEFVQENNPTQGWEPIGVQDSPFKGVFHGEGHTISGVFSNRPSTDFVGFFGFAEDATIENLTIECSSISGGNYTGSFCGMAQLSSITNVTTTADVQGKDHCGGLVGMAYSTTLSDCAHSGDVTGSGEEVGGFGGSLTGTVTNSSHTGNVSGGGYTGGFAGHNAAGITGCTATAQTITGTGDYVGGMLGYNLGRVANSTSTGTVSGINETGGFVGHNENATITQSRHQGDVTGNLYLGGFIGRAIATVTTDCQTEATLKGSGYVGGFVGSANGITATRCYAVGDVTATTDSDYPVSGGFAGYTRGSIQVNSCGAISNVTVNSYNGNSYASGFIAYLHNDEIAKTIANCFAVGDVNATGTLVGGLAGNAFYTSIANSYFSGNLTGTDKVGGIVGAGNHVTLDKNYANGSIAGNRYVGGIAGSFTDSGTITSSVAAQDVINAINGDIGRIYGYIDDSSSVGTIGTNEGNRGLTTMRVVSGGQQLTAEDNEQNGTSLGKGLLKYKSSYQGLNWDFSDVWTILETESYPYKPSQSAPPVITSTLTAGGTTIAGKCASGVEVYVQLGGRTYQATVSGTTWTVNVDAMQSGETAKAYTKASGLIQSYFVTETVGYSGNGTEEAPYLIYTAEDLANINSYSYYKIMNDIDVTDWIGANSPTKGWLPIGLDGGGSMKQLDGNGHQITGVWCNNGSNNTGLIASMENATVKNLTVVVADGKALKGSGNNVGVIAGKAIGSTFSNITVSGDISGATYVGGISGYADACVYDNCTASEVTITASGNYAGAITGCNSGGSFAECVVSESSVSGASYVGGISGKVDVALTGHKVTATDITATGDYAGGIVGYTTGDISNCVAEITLEGKDYIGGIVGNTTASIELSKASGEVTTTDLVNCRAGGIVGYTTGDIANSYSTANTRGGQYTGGIAGYSFGKIDNCYSSGDLYATNFGSGIVGYLEGSRAAVNHCFAINNKIDVSDQNGVAMRVIGGFKNGAATPQSNNYALKTMVVSINDVTQRIYDDPLEGISVDAATLMKQATYAAQGWDFNDIWGINDSEGYPYLLALTIEDTPDVLQGDVNGDGKVNVSDYVTTASYILEQDPQPFVFAAADLDGNNIINVTDLVGVASIALTYQSSAPRRAPAVVMTGDATMTATLSGNELVVSLDNSVDITALQLDVTLPDGIEVSDASLTRRGTGSHTIDVARVAGGDYRLLAASSALQAFKRNDGAVLRITLTGNAYDTVTLHGIEVATPDAQGIALEDIILAPVATGVHDANAATRIYAADGNIVVETPVSGQVMIALPNGMRVTREVNAGRNVIAAPGTGVLIVRMNGTTAKVIL